MKKTVKMISLALVFSIVTACGGEPASSASSTEAIHAQGLFVNEQQLDTAGLMKVDGVEIPFELYRYYYLSSRDRLDGGNAAHWADEGGEDALADLKEYVKSSILSGLAFEALAAQKGIALTEAETQTVEESLKVAHKQFGDEAYEATLRTMYMTQDLYRTLLMTSSLYNKVLTQVYSDEVLADVQQNYLHAKQIFIAKSDAVFSGSSAPESEAKAAGDTAAAALQKLADGGDFDAIKKEFSEDTAQPDEGYYFTVGDMDEALTTATQALAEDEISGIVETEKGYYIIKRLPIDDAFVKANVLTLMSDAVRDVVDMDLQKYMDQMKVEFGGNYEQVAPDTLF